MSDLHDLLADLARAVHRPADHPLDDLLAAVDALEGAPAPVTPAPEPAPVPAPEVQPSDPDTPSPVFGTESQPESA
jgi:hypothetical protein